MKTLFTFAFALFAFVCLTSVFGHNPAGEAIAFVGSIASSYFVFRTLVNVAEITTPRTQAERDAVIADDLAARTSVLRNDFLALRDQVVATPMFDSNHNHLVSTIDAWMTHLAGDVTEETFQNAGLGYVAAKRGLVEFAARYREQRRAIGLATPVTL